MNSGIYTITNKFNGKIYVGYSTNMSRRMYKHQRDLKANEHANPHLQSAYNHYGEDCFDFEVLEFHQEMSILPSMENYWVNMLKSNDREYGYNIACTSDRHVPYKWSDETRQRMKEKYIKTPHPNTGKRHSEETKRKMSESGKNKVFTDLQREKISKSKIEYWTVEKRKEMSERMKGRKLSDDAKKAISDKAKQRTGEKASNYGNRREKNPMTKKVIDTVTGTIYPSMWHAAEAHGTTYDNLRQRLGGRRKNNTTLIYLENYINEH